MFKILRCSWKCGPTFEIYIKIFIFHSLQLYYIALSIFRTFEPISNQYSISISPPPPPSLKMFQSYFQLQLPVYDERYFKSLTSTTGLFRYGNQGLVVWSKSQLTLTDTFDDQIIKYSEQIFGSKGVKVDSKPKTKTLKINSYIISDWLVLPVAITYLVNKNLNESINNHLIN